MSDAYRTGSKAELEHSLIVGVTKGLIAWASLASQRATLKAPVKTTRLARSIHVGEATVISRGVMAIAIGTNVEYAAAQEFGSGIHAPNPADRRLIEIRPRRGKALAFKWAGGPTDISAYDSQSRLWFFKVVYHPGVPAHPYLRPGIQETREAGIRLALSAVAAELHT